MAKMKDSLESSLTMALGARGQRLTLTNPNDKGFKISHAVRADYQIDTGDAMVDEGDKATLDKDGPWS